MLHGCETWFLTLREECRSKVFEDRILRRTFGPKWDEKGEWRRLHNEELQSLYHSPNIEGNGLIRLRIGIIGEPL